MLPARGERSGVQVSVVIPTRRRPDGLARCLRGLRDDLAGYPGRQDVEVLIVDNDPGGPTAAAVEQAVNDFRRHAHVPVRVIPEPAPGASYARNRGIAAATGRVVAMLDDDVVPRPGWLAAITAPVLEGRAGGAAGRVVLDPAVRPPRWLDIGAVGGYLTYHDLGPRPRDLDYFADCAVTANAAWKRDALVRVGGFDPSLGPRGRVHLVADDARLTRDVLGLGERVVWCPDAVVVHELPAGRMRLAWLVRRAWWQGRSDWRLERPELENRRLGGTWAGLVQIGRWLRQELAARAREGLRRRAVAVHALLDVVRMLGRLREVVATATGTSAGSPAPRPASWVRTSDHAGFRSPREVGAGEVDATRPATGQE